MTVPATGMWHGMDGEWSHEASRRSTVPLKKAIGQRDAWYASRSSSSWTERVKGTAVSRTTSTRN